MSILLFVTHSLWSIIDDSGFVVSSIMPSVLSPLSFQQLTGKMGTRPMLAMPLSYRVQVDIDHLDVTAFLNKPAWQSDVNLQARLEGEGLAPQELRSAVHVEIHPSHLGDIKLYPSQIDLQARQNRFQVRRF